MDHQDEVFLQACENDNLEEVKHIIGNKLHSKYGILVPALYRAVRNRHPDIVREILTSQQPQMILSNCDILAVAAEGGCKRVVGFLFEYGKVNVNFRKRCHFGYDACSMPAICTAAVNGHEDIVRFLASREWSPVRIFSCCEQSFNGGNHEAINKERWTTVIMILLKHTLHENVRSSIFQNSVRGCSVEVFAMILKNKRVNPNCASSNGCLIANLIQNSHIGKVKLLIEDGRAVFTEYYFSCVRTTRMAGIMIKACNVDISNEKLTEFKNKWGVL